MKNVFILSQSRSFERGHEIELWGYLTINKPEK